MANPTTIRLDPETERMARELCDHLAIKRAGVIRMAIRKLYLSEIPKPQDRPRRKATDEETSQVVSEIRTGRGPG